MTNLHPIVRRLCTTGIQVCGILLWITATALGQSSSGDTASEHGAAPPAYSAHTAIDPRVPQDQLRVMVKPLTKSELQVEADAWFKLLRAKAREIAGVRMGVKKTNEALGTDDDQAAKETLSVAESITKKVTDESQAEEDEVTSLAQENLGIDDGEDDTPAEAQTPADDETETEAGGTDSSAQPAAVNEAAVADESAQPAPPADSAAGAEPSAEVQPPSAEVHASAEVQPSAEVHASTVDSANRLRGEMLTTITKLQDQRTALSDRLGIVLDSLEAKGGDVEEYRLYSARVAGIEVDTSDFAAAWTGFSGWLASHEGGQRLGWNVGRFILTLVLTYFIAKVVAVIGHWLLDRKLKLSRLAERLIASTIKNLVMLIGFAVALTALEVDITPVLAAIGATGLVVGLALQGTLSNFASGLMILINRPFDVGNVVSAGGVTGTVDQMNLVSTTFRTFDNQTIHVPNNEIWNHVITNITANPTRRVDLEFSVGYDDDFERAENLIKDVLAENDLVLSNPKPDVVTHELADSSVKIICQPWAKTSDWWRVKTEVTREVKRRFDQAGISFPYPQQDVHVYRSASKLD